MKQQWQSFTKDQLNHFPELVKRKDQIEKDLYRTDIANPYFKQKKSIDMLRNILITHCFYNWNLGYLQGMNSLLAPILNVLDDEVDGFWCFVGLMSIFGINFRVDMNAIYENLIKFSKLVTFAIPNLHDHLTKRQSSHMLFCYRWFLLQFSDLVGPENTQRLWEIFWTDIIPDFFFFFCTAVLFQFTNTILNDDMDFGDIMFLVQSATISINESLNLAMEFYHFVEKNSDTRFTPILALTKIN